MFPAQRTPFRVMRGFGSGFGIRVSHLGCERLIAWRGSHEVTLAVFTLDHVPIGLGVVANPLTRNLNYQYESGRQHRGSVSYPVPASINLPLCNEALGVPTTMAHGMTPGGLTALTSLVLHLFSMHSKKRRGKDATPLVYSLRSRPIEPVSVITSTRCVSTSLLMARTC